MSVMLQDGTGRGYLAKVDSKGRMSSESVSRGFAENASLNGDSYNINTGIINLTSSNKSAVIFLKNTSSTEDIIISNLFYLIGNSSNGTGDTLITVLRNPTTGTIIDTKTDVEMNVNRNFGSSNVLSSQAYKGFEGATFTNGDKVIESIFNQGPTRAAISVGQIVLTQGTSIGIDYTPGSGNTNLDVEFAIGLHTEPI